MLTTENIKRFFAIVILVCFFLPLSQCTVKMPQAQNGSAQAPTKTEIFVPSQMIHFDDLSEIVLVVLFAWPLCFCALRRFAATKMKKIIANSLEVVCGLASIGYLWLNFQFWGELRYGGVIVLLAFAIYVIVSAYDLLRYCRRELI